ncbi:MAG: aldehyde ferredoxin oxidoreductase N-terminal domain-containing protein [Desulfurella sp.]|uniref:aldehyde ferredoxin oxidoreductase N-terminal domain-containing protein n=1 Tax=Desulfurella sp. TaxID=1962857 RepID=UPI003C90301A
MNNFYMLDINLSTNESKVVDITDVFREYIGGSGAATKLFIDSCKDNTDPLSQNSVVVFAIGPTNNHFPVITKTIAVFKSPLTGDFGESHAGGNVGLAMYQAGFHVLRIIGKSQDFSYLEIYNENVKIIKADSLRGMSATACERVLLDRYKHINQKSIIKIGPAGERLSPIACVSVDSSRHFGRLGLGAIFGSKNLKAIVIAGNKYWNAPKGKYNAIYNSLYKEVTQSELMHKYHDLGTAANVMPLNKINGLPVRNYSQGFFEGADKISGKAMADKHLAQKIACAGCQVGCIHVAQVRVMFEKEHHMYKTKKVTYDHEPIYAFGSNLSIENSDALFLLLHEVERQGWDVMSMGVTLAWASEAFQKGIIDTRHTMGEILNFGDGETYLRVLINISKGANEFYKDLEKGSYFCSKKYGGEDFAILFNKNEAAGYLTGIMTFLGYATDTRHSHLGNAGYSIDQKLKNNETPIEERMEELYNEGIWRIIFTSIAGCLFARGVYHKESLIPDILSVIGFDGYDDDKLWQIARKVHALKWRFKLTNGFDFEELKLPKKLLSVITSNGIIKQDEFKKGIEIFKNYVNEDLKILSS